MVEMWIDEDYIRNLPRLLRTAESRIRISLYSVVLTGKSLKKSSSLLIDQLSNLSNHGIECLVLFNMVAKGGYLKAQNQKAIAQLRRYGVQTRKLVGSRINHAKFVVIDNKAAIVGSHNWTQCSLRRNSEVSMLTDDPAAVKQLADNFDHLWKNSVKLKAEAGFPVSKEAQ